jgi:biotin carboxyl carrier protein
MEITIGGEAFTVHVIDPRALPTGGSASGATSGRARITAPMPGKIVRVLVEQGAEVAAGDGLLVVEAMKMQNEIKAPKSGMVVELYVEQGATVAAGDVLVIVE